MKYIRWDMKPAGPVSILASTRGTAPQAEEKDP